MPDVGSVAPVVYRELPEIDGYRFGSDGAAQSCWEGHGPASHKTDHWHDLFLNLGRGRRYLRVCVKRDGKRVKLDLHPLVCKAHHGPCPPGLECCHKDDDPLHNAADNLYWGSRHQNIADRRRNGIQPLGEQFSHAKLTEPKVREAKARYKSGETLTQIAKDLGVALQTIHDAVVRHKSWKHIA